jgi:hypothetical protein
VNGGGRAGKIVNPVDFHVQWEGNVVTKRFEIGVLEIRNNVPLGACVEVIYREHVATVVQQMLAKVSPEKARTACY